MGKTVVSLFAGSLILWGAVQRYRTINSIGFNKTVKLTLFIFIAFSIGLCLVDFDRAEWFIDIMLHNNNIGFWRLFMWLSPAAIPVAYKLLYDEGRLHENGG